MPIVQLDTFVKRTLWNAMRERGGMYGAVLIRLQGGGVSSFQKKTL